MGRHQSRPTNLAKHGVDFRLAAQALLDPDALSREDDRHDYGEIRTVTLGMAHGHLIPIVVSTDRAHRTRIISARIANARQRHAYHEGLTP